VIKDVPIECVQTFLNELVKNRIYKGERIISVEVTKAKSGYAVIVETTRRKEQMALTDFLKNLF